MASPRNSHKRSPARTGETTSREAHLQRFARECGLNPKQVVDRVGVLSKSAIAEAATAESEVAAMPAGGHAILAQTRQAVERRARALIEQLQELGDGQAVETFDGEGAAVSQAPK
jgi:hypothetical protein